MLAPEVWTFDPPANNLKVHEGSLGSSDEIERVIKSHHFNHLVSVVLPDTPQVPQSIVESLSSDNDYYKVNAISAHEFVEKEFLDAFVKRGHLTILSIDSHIDLEDCMSLADGNLVLSLNKESYQELGLEGKAIQTKNKEHRRFVVTLDLTASYFKPGKRNYERAYDCLKNCLHAFNVILAWETQDEKICPSSIASYFCERGLNVEVCKPKLNQRRDFNVDVPLLYPSDKECDIEEMVEWLGSFSLDVQRDSSPEQEFLSTYCGPQETVECGQVAYMSWQGFFTKHQVYCLFKALREYFCERDSVPWVSMYVQGFADATVSCKFRPHTFFSDGDNCYTMLLKPKNAYMLASHYSNNRLIK